MKTTVKLAIAGSLAIIGSVANAATIDILPAAPTGSSLVLLAKDYTTNTFFVQVLNATVSSVNSSSTLTSAGAGQYSLDDPAPSTGSLIVPSLLGSFTSSNFQSFVNSGGNSSTDNIKWTILGASQGTGTLQTGAQSIVFTSALDYLNDVYVVGNDVAGGRNEVTNFFSADINANGVYVNGKGSFGWDDTNVYGGLADTPFGDANAKNGGNLLGGGQYLYQLTTSAEGAGANVYKSQGLLTVDAATGTFSYTAADLGGGAQVPVPAAIWLLGSGLAGLAGIGRRKKLAVAAA